MKRFLFVFISLTFFQDFRIWVRLLNASVYVSMIIHAICFYAALNLEVIVIKVFFMFSLFVPWLTQKFISSSEKGAHKWFLALYTPHLLYSLWFACWGITHRWYLYIIYPVISFTCYTMAWISLNKNK